MTQSGNGQNKDVNPNDIDVFDTLRAKAAEILRTE